MSIKAFVNGNEVIIGGPGGESLPLGTIVDIDSTEIPEGWEKVNEETVDEQISSLTPHTYYYTITENIQPGQDVIIPCKYIVGLRYYGCIFKWRKISIKYRYSRYKR